MHESKAAAPMQRASETAAKGGPKVEKGIEEVPDRYIDSELGFMINSSKLSRKNAKSENSFLFS